MKQTKLQEINKSRPLVIKVTNTSNTTKQKVKLFNPNAINEANYGNPEILKIESEGIGLEYKDILSFLIGKCIKIKVVMIVSLSNSKSILNLINVHTENLRNQTYSGLRLAPIIDPYQNQTNIVVTDTNFTLNNIDGFSELSLVVDESTSFMMYLYMENDEVESKSQEPKPEWMTADILDKP